MGSFSPRVLASLAAAALLAGCAAREEPEAAEPAPPDGAAVEPVVRVIPYEGAFGPSDPPGMPLPPMQTPLEPWVVAALDVWWERPSPKGPPPIPVPEPEAIRIEGKGPVIQILPGPPAFPEKIPERLQVVFPGEVPYSNNVKRLPSGSFRAVAFDNTYNDTKISDDSMAVEISFTDANGDEWRIEQVTLAPISPNPIAEPWFGGLIMDTLYHGHTGNGTPAEPLVRCMLCSWGWSDVYKNGRRVASSALLHVMLTSDVRAPAERNFEYMCYDCAENPVREVHVIVPPSAYLPSPGGFLHVMWEDAEWERGPPERIAAEAPALEENVPTIELAAAPYLTWNRKEIHVEAGRKYRLIVHNEDPSSFHQFHLHSHPEEAAPAPAGFDLGHLRHVRGAGRVRVHVPRRKPLPPGDGGQVHREREGARRWKVRSAGKDVVVGRRPGGHAALAGRGRFEGAVRSARGAGSAAIPGRAAAGEAGQLRRRARRLAAVLPGRFLAAGAGRPGGRAGSSGPAGPEAVAGVIRGAVRTVAFIIVAAAAAAPAPAAGQAGSVAREKATSPPPPAERAAGVPLDRNPAAAVTFDRILRAPVDEPGNWLTYHGSYAAHRFSRLDQVDAGNVTRLREAWQLYLPIPHGFEATPLVVDGVMYFTTGGHTAVYAVDAATGRERWHRVFEVAEDVPACCDWVNRGVAIGDGKVYFVTLDARLVALDARTGETVWQQTLADWRDGYTATVAPLFVKDKVVTGISGGEYGIRGFLDAYDARTGERAWRFWTVPGPGEPGHETWRGELPTWLTGGAPTWVTGSYDPELDLLYWTTGNPGPDFNGEVRPGDNLYADAVLAFDPDDGRLVWYYQWTPHNIWDYDGVNEVILTDLPIRGETVRALIHADKNGFFYVLDRTDGDFIQAKAFARQTWAKRLDPQTGRPVVDSVAMLTSAMEPLCPGPAGAKEWNHMAFSPVTGLAYIPVIENCATFRAGQAFYRRGLPFWGSVADPAALGPGESHGKLLALDPTTLEPVWEIPTTWPVMSGVLATAGGLVFWGEADGTLHATDARTGEDLWTHEAPMGMHAPPMTYAVDGKQYIAFPVGWGGWINGFAPGLREGRRGHLLLVYALP